MVRRHPVALSIALAGAMTLAGCSDLPGAFDTTLDDVAVASKVWGDPWVAPDSATAPGPGYGSNGWVDREVARRTTPYRSPVEAAAEAELGAAAAAGWVPTSSGCEGDEVRVALVGPDAALASLVVTPDGGGSEVVLSAVTPHHLDKDWAAPSPATDTCLDGGEDDYTEPPGGSEPLRESDVPEADGASWQAEELPDESKLLLAAVNTDPALSALDVQVTEPTLDEGDNRRRAPAAETTVEATDLRALADLLPGWQLTYAACGAEGPVRATFLGDLDAGPAVIGALVEPSGATLRVTLPVAEGPEPTWLAAITELTDTRCWRRTPRRLVVDGTPAVLPDVLTPIAD
ncbi:hypothetical protein EXE58_08610 [Nocardioides seonyuensis]|uniref:GerMN domain-containing protein n=1 Tax=Nocardioides seonyuensis TaxID=2518371 RepID=A0A4P7IE83_9ACTN|nr:hypothetical protein [Nocardioides seonyuensis]QBX55506.1 hypothetical protein EXE58_08610 [Nocardioides seonyuensis]